MKARPHPRYDEEYYYTDCPFQLTMEVAVGSGSMGVARSNSGTYSTSAVAPAAAAAVAEVPAAASIPAALPQEPLPEAKKNKVKPMIELFLINPDDDEMVAEIQQVFPPQYHVDLVTKMLHVALEKRVKEVGMIAKFLLHLVSTNTILPNNFVAGLKELLEFAPDLHIDIPMLYEYLGKLIAPQIEKKHITFVQLYKLCENIISSNHGPLLLKAVIGNLKDSMGPSFIKSKWQESGLQLNQWMSEDQEVSLQQTRIDLIDMLEGDEDGCYVCNRLKCRYHSLITPANTMSSRPGHHDIPLNYMRTVAPPAHTLPTPVWDEQIVPTVSAIQPIQSPEERKQRDVEAWVREATPEPQGGNDCVLYPGQITNTQDIPTVICVPSSIDIRVEDIWSRNDSREDAWTEDSASTDWTPFKKPYPSTPTNHLASCWPSPKTHTNTWPKEPPSPSIIRSAQSEESTGHIFGAIGEPVPRHTAVDAFFKRFKYLQNVPVHLVGQLGNQYSMLAHARQIERVSRSVTTENRREEHMNSNQFRECCQSNNTFLTAAIPSVEYDTARNPPQQNNSQFSYVATTGQFCSNWQYDSQCLSGTAEKFNNYSNLVAGQSYQYLSCPSEQIHYQYSNLVNQRARAMSPYSRLATAGDLMQPFLRVPYTSVSEPQLSSFSGPSKSVQQLGRPYPVSDTTNVTYTIETPPHAVFHPYNPHYYF